MLAYCNDVIRKETHILKEGRCQRITSTSKVSTPEHVLVEVKESIGSVQDNEKDEESMI